MYPMSKLTPKTALGRRRRRHARVRRRVRGSASRPRLAVFRSNKALYAQLIDDDAGKTLASATSLGVPGETLRERAEMVGGNIARAALKQGITEIVFDRGGFAYAGHIKALADAARVGGLIV